MINLKESFPLHFRIGLLTTIVLFILAFQFAPVKKTGEIKKRRVTHEFKVERIAQKVKKIVEPLERQRVKVPVESQTPESETMEKNIPEGGSFGDKEIEVKRIVFTIVEEMPEVLNMEEARKYLEYPEICRKAGIEGTVYLKLLVNEFGEVEQVEILKSLHEACDAAAVRFAYHLRFRPGKQRDIPVPVYVSFPVVFRLSE